MSEWLDLQLSHHLAAVEAPEALWERIQGAANLRPARPRVGPSFTSGWFHFDWFHSGWFNSAWPIAAILTLMAAAGTLWLVAKGEEPALDLRQLAIQELRDAEPVELHSSDPAQISAWIGRAGLDVKLPSKTAAAVRLVGARVIERRGARIGEIRYRVGPDTATLLVARAGSGASSGTSFGTGGGHRRLAWRSRGQSYAVASSSPERPDAPCLLCHASL